MSEELKLNEDSLSDASLIEDEDEEDVEEPPPPRGGSVPDENMEEEQSENEAESIIDLPGDPITAPLEADTGSQDQDKEQTEASDEEMEIASDDAEVDNIFWPRDQEQTKGGNDSLEYGNFMGWRDDELQADMDSQMERIPVTEDLENIKTLAEIEGALSVVFKSEKQKFSGQPKSTKVSKTKVNKSPAIPSKHDTRAWRPSAHLFKPLSAGWVREVVYQENDDGSLNKGIAPQISYYAPPIPGTKPRVFQSIQELQHQVNFIDPTLSWHNFSFRQEIMGAPEGQEVVRGINQIVELFPKRAPEKPVQPEHSPPNLKIEEPPPQGDNPSEEIFAPKNPLISSSPASGLKVKTFSKMKERNSFGESDPINDDSDAPIERTTSDPNNAALPKELSKLGVPSKSNRSSVKTNIPPVKKSKKGAKKLAISPNLWSAKHYKTKQVLRPTNSKSVACSIHCPGVMDAFPSLSCISCHSMFHPLCVGLVDGGDYSDYDFYCSNCKPPPGKENSQPFSHSPKVTSHHSTSSPSPFKLPKHRQFSDTNGEAFATEHILPRGLSIIPTSKKNLPNGPGASSITSMRKENETKRPLENQSIVNIAGIRYLIVPQRQETSKTKVPQDSSRQSAKKLPLLLKPHPDAPDSAPSFEVEETSDGKLLLLPTTGPIRRGETHPFTKAKSKNAHFANEGLSQIVPKENFCSFLSSSYFAMVHVFRYLNLHDKLIARRVCKLWRDLASNPTIWRNVSLKGVRVIDWTGFVSFINKCQTERLDMRKMLFSKSQEETWNDILESFVGLQYLTEIQFPSVTSSMAAQVANACPKVVSIIASNLCSKEVDFMAFQSSKRAFEEITLKMPSGKMKFPGGLQFSVTLASSLKRLSLLGIESVTLNDFQAIATIENLEELEIGSCASSPLEMFQYITSLTKLRTLRVENAKIDSNIGELRWLSSLDSLELIDVELKTGFGEGLTKLHTLTKFLLIPFYTEEVASVNAELVDSVMSMEILTHFFLGLTNEWLESMSSLLASGKTMSKDSFPITVNGLCEMYSLSKLFKTLSNAMPQCKVKILKMSKVATGKQFIQTLLR